MFLITTADQHFWKIDGKILFLGEWCKIYSQRHLWQNLDSQTLPYHFDDRKYLYQNYRYLRNVYESYLSHLAEELNEIHKVDHSERFWRILIGPWLSFFIEIFYDRVLSISTACQSGKITDTYITDPSKSDKWIPNDLSRFQAWQTRDPYNHYLYSLLIKEIAGFPYTLKATQSDQTDYETYYRKIPSTNRLRFKYFLSSILQYSPDLPKKIAIIDTFKSFDRIRLQLALGQTPSLVSPEIIIPEHAIDEHLRDNIRLDVGENTFESLLDKYLPWQIPRAYLEGFRYLIDQTMERFPKSPKAIIAGYNATNEARKMWTACKVEAGSKLAFVQHGGHDGTGLWSSIEYDQRKVADLCYSWGWRDSEEVKPMPTRRLPKLPSDPSGDILWVANSWPRYFYRMYSIPGPNQLLDYLDEQFRFASSLDAKPFKLVLLRLFYRDFGWNEQNRWKDKFPKLRLDIGSQPINGLLSKCRLCIATSNTTTYLETMAANLPTIIFWKPQHWEIRPSAEPFFDKLEKVGIFHRTPESAAAGVNEIYFDPQKWWQRTDVQHAREVFCRNYAHTSRNWLRQWKNELKDLAKNNVP